MARPDRSMLFARTLVELSWGADKMKAYVFGAGASVHAHYPLASKLWPSVEEWARTEPLAHVYRSAADNLNELFDTSKPFEMCLTELDNRISHTSDQFLVSLRNHAQMMVTTTLIPFVDILPNSTTSSRRGFLRLRTQ